MVTIEDVLNAQARIRGHVRVTPVIEAAAQELGLSELGTIGSVVLKLESLQHTGTFKARGAFNRILSAKESTGLPDAGVICASGGNAGAAVAYAARKLGIKAEIFVPMASSAVKVKRLRDLDAEVVIGGALYSDAYEACLKRTAETGALMVHAYDQPEVVAGQGTLGLEFLEQVEDLDTLLVAVGGGGLIGGIATAIGSRVNVVAVEPANIPTLHSALQAGAPVDVEVGGIATDSLGAKRIGHLAFAATSAAGVQSVLVTDDSIRQARQRLWDEFRIAAEFGGAAALAALVEGAYRPADGERVGVVMCGGNTDPSDLVQ